MIYLKIPFIVLATMLLSSADAAPAKKPNILFILSDDQGYGDLGCYGHPTIKSPNLDKLAAEGTRFTDFHSPGMSCSPSRAGFLTGRTPYRSGIYASIPGVLAKPHTVDPQDPLPPASPVHLKSTEITLATLLKSAGYATCHVGKWHLCGQPLNRNLHRTQPDPGDHGFDHWFAAHGNGFPTPNNPDDFVRNGKPLGRLRGHYDSLIVDEAVSWLKGLPKDRPFLLHVWTDSPHTPLAPPKKYVQMYDKRHGKLKRHYFADVTHLDYQVGRLLKALDNLNLRDNTMVIFASDNGPRVGSAGPLRGSKGSAYEGGHRVPGIIRWPGHAKPGTVCDEPINGTDLLPTACALAGVPVPGDRPIDGVSILPVFDGRPLERQVPLYWQYNRANQKVKVAMREGHWKILAALTGRDIGRFQGGDNPGDNKAIKQADLKDFELYHLGNDIGEKRNLASDEPKRLHSMSGCLERLYREVRAEGPLWPDVKPPSIRPILKGLIYYGPPIKSKTGDTETPPAP